jgi:phospholipase/lecithinase/hemolysin
MACGTFRRVKSLRQFTAILFFFGGLVFSSKADFSSIYIWGDSLSTTTNNYSPPDPQFYGMRESNGRTWVEVLAQRQGLGANSITNVNWDYSSNNLSFFGQYSPILVTNIAKFVQPANATNCLFVVWVNNADFVGDVNSSTVGDPASAPNSGTNVALWTTAINQHLTNHFNIITNLYAKGCRTLIAPNAADITEVPDYNNSPTAWRAFVRQQITSFNTNYAAMLKQISANTNYPGLAIYNPDIFSLLDNVLTNAASYGLTNALYDAGEGTGPQSIDVIDAYLSYNLLSSAALNGPGTNYIFWDSISPTAKFSEVIADYVQQYLSPAQFSRIAQAGGSNRLDVVNMPVGLTGLVLSSTNLTQKNWLTNSSFSSLTVTQSVYAPVSGPRQFYRLNFPWQWTWP